jgi:uncharacterized protein YoxC
VVDPLFWLGLSVLLVAISLTAVLVALLPTLRELGRAARSAEKLFDTLSRELPPTLESIRLTGLELTDLTDDVGQSVQSAGRVVKQVDQSLLGVRQQAKKVQKTTRNVMVGVRAAWQSFTQASAPKRTSDRLSDRSTSSTDFEAAHYLNHTAETYGAESEAELAENVAAAAFPSQSRYRDEDASSARYADTGEQFTQPPVNSSGKLELPQPMPEDDL